MIDKNEIRCGNWFEHNANWCYRSPAEIKIFQFQWEDRDWYALGECGIWLDDCFSIPLSPSILESCGFKENKLLEPCYELGKISVRYNMVFYDGYRVSENNYNYLHQFQNLIYALTGAELNYQP